MTCGTWDTASAHLVFIDRGITFYAGTFQCSSINDLSLTYAVPQPRMYMYTRFRLVPFRSPLLGESLLISFPRGTEMFHFPRSASAHYEFMYRYCVLPHSGLPHSDIFGSTLARQLPEAFRSHPRPSSLSSAKASAVCSSYLKNFGLKPDLIRSLL